MIQIIMNDIENDKSKLFFSLDLLKLGKYEQGSSKGVL